MRRKRLVSVLSWHLERIAFGVFLKEIDEHLKRVLTGPDPERDRTIFWLYFRQGMSTKEIASLPGTGLGGKGVGSVIERLKQRVRELVVGPRTDPPDEEKYKKQISSGLRIDIYGCPEIGTSIR